MLVLLVGIGAVYALILFYIAARLTVLQLQLQKLHSDFVRSFPCAELAAELDREMTALSFPSTRGVMDK